MFEGQAGTWIIHQCQVWKMCSWIPFLPVLPSLPAAAWAALQVSLCCGAPTSPGCHPRDIGPSQPLVTSQSPSAGAAAASSWGSRLHWGFWGGFVFWQRRNCALSVGLYPQPMKKPKPQIRFVTLLSFCCVCPNLSHCAVTLPKNSSFNFYFFL